MKYKTGTLTADENGKITGYFSTYDKTPDSYGDIIEPGAFTGTIERRKASGKPFPLCWNHSLELDDIIGAVNPEDIEDTEKGPRMTAAFFDTEKAQQAREIVKSGAVYQFSFAYDVIKRRDPTAAEKAADVWNVLQELELYEISIVPVPANQNAQVIDVKAGARNSAADTKEALEAIEEMESNLRAQKKAIERIKAIYSASNITASEQEDNGEEEPKKANAAAEEPEAINPEIKESLLARIKNIQEEKSK